MALLSQPGVITTPTVPTTTDKKTTPLLTAPLPTTAPSATSTTASTASVAPTSGTVSTTSVDPSVLNVTTDQTVQGQIAGIIAQDSPLQQLATTSALQQANTRGLLNSSMAVGAAQDAVIQSATPIAQQDAQTYANAAQLNTTEENKVNMFNSELSSQDQQFNISQENATSQFNVAEQNKILSQSLDIASQQAMNDADNTYSALIAQNQGAAQLYDTYQAAINAILTNPELDSASKQAAIDAQLGMLQAGMAMYTPELSGLNLDSILQFGDTTGGDTSGGSSGSETGATTATDTAASYAATSSQAEWDAKAKPLQDALAMTTPDSLIGKSLQSQLNALGPRPV